MAGSLHTPEYAVFRALLQKAREDASVSQSELASLLDRPQSFVSKYEAGERRLDVVEFVLVSRALKLDPVTLLRRLIEKLP